MRSRNGNIALYIYVYMSKAISPNHKGNRHQVVFAPGFALLLGGSFLVMELINYL